MCVFVFPVGDTDTGIPGIRGRREYHCITNTTWYYFVRCKHSLYYVFGVGMLEKSSRICLCMLHILLCVASFVWFFRVGILQRDRISGFLAKNRVFGRSACHTYCCVHLGFVVCTIKVTIHFGNIGSPAYIVHHVAIRFLTT